MALAPPIANGVADVVKLRHRRLGIVSRRFIALALPDATKSSTIRKRLQSHVRERGNWGLGRLTDVERFTFVYYQCDDDTAARIESHVTSTEKPPFNVKPEYKKYVTSITVH